MDGREMNSMHYARSTILILCAGLICSCAGCLSEPATVDPCELIAGLTIANNKSEFGWPLGTLATILYQNYGIPRDETFGCRDPPDSVVSRYPLKARLWWPGLYCAPTITDHSLSPCRPRATKCENSRIRACVRHYIIYNTCNASVGGVDGHASDSPDTRWPLSGTVTGESRVVAW